ncbi:MAG TPA: protein kinase [Candidatus Acidoferrales bacterium]|jgi:serine/threonine-protein kinase|nr:protein kinase [Candidatus Acidoferrales bacterium]
MTLTAGTKLGPYEILAPLGAGGMGEVYRARDTRLDRTVAVKILSSHLSSDPTLRQRFDREAKAISSLNHPHICVLHDVGHQGDTDFLVMEYLEGETLATRLEKGPLPLDQVLQYGIQIADALDRAHRSGVVHRDLKPGNIMLTKSGAKLLDFGLAKSTAPLVEGATLAAAATRTTPVTQQGTIVGTFQYMSPEQVEGLEVDARSDIFSFGAVLYEMLTGQRAFQGKSRLSVASAVVEKDPTPIAALQPLTPPALERTIQRCLAKDPEDRWQTARDVLLELKWVAEAGSQAGVAAPIVSHRKARERLAWVGVAAMALIAVAFAIAFAMRAPKPPQPIRLTADSGADASLYTDEGPSAVLSPDSSRVAFVGTGSDLKRRIFMRSLDQLQANPLSGTEGARNPFFSPDGQWLGFFADRKLKKISVQGGAAVTLCDAANDRGGSWGEDGAIVFAPDVRVPLSKVSSSGGTPQSLTTLDQQAGEVTQRWPQVLPGGKAVLFTSSTNGNDYEDSEIVAYSVATGQRKTVQRGGFYGRYLPSGHIVYVHEGTLFAVPFDLKRLEVTGQPAPVLEGVMTASTNGGAQFSFSETGNLAYVAGRGGGLNLSIYWMDKDGKFTPLREIPAHYNHIRLSPDGKRLALEIQEGRRSDIWVYEWDRDTLTRLTFNGESNVSPVWTPDGQRIAYASQEKSGTFNIWWKRADGAGDAQRLTESKNNEYPESWSPDGKTLALHELSPSTNFDILTMLIEGNEKLGWKPGEPKPFLNSPFVEVLPAFSPDGRWLAYASNESGSLEMYVRPFPGPGGKWQISNGGGVLPTWSRNGKELFYRTLENKIFVAAYTASGDSFHAEKPQLWSPGQFSGGTIRNYDLAPDGKRFAVLKAPGTGEVAPVSKVTFIFNFFDELRAKISPAKN